MSSVQLQNLFISSSPGSYVAQTVASLACAALRDDIQVYGRASLVVSSTPAIKGVLRFLFSEALEWERVSIGVVSSAVEAGGFQDRSLVESLMDETPACAAQFVPLGGRSCDPEEDSKLADDAYLTLLPFSFSLLTMEDNGHILGWGVEVAEYELFAGETDRAVDWRADDNSIPGSYYLALTRAALSRSRRAALILSSNEQDKRFEEIMQQTEVRAAVREVVDDLGARIVVFNSSDLRGDRAQ